MHIDNIKYPIRVLGSQSLAEKNCVEKLDPYKIPIKIEHFFNADTGQNSNNQGSEDTNHVGRLASNFTKINLLLNRKS